MPKVRLERGDVLSLIRLTSSQNIAIGGDRHSKHKKRDVNRERMGERKGRVRKGKEREEKRREKSERLEGANGRGGRDTR